jgi:hypothetical protein
MIFELDKDSKKIIATIQRNGDGENRDQVGYVTSMNSIVVLVIGEEQTEFSQIFPSLITEPGA